MVTRKQQMLFYWSFLLAVLGAVAGVLLVERAPHVFALSALFASIVMLALAAGSLAYLRRLSPASTPVRRALILLFCVWFLVIPAAQLLFVSGPAVVAPQIVAPDGGSTTVLMIAGSGFGWLMHRFVFRLLPQRWHLWPQGA